MPNPFEKGSIKEALANDSTGKLALGLATIIFGPDKTTKENVESLKQLALGASDQVTSLPAMGGAAFEGVKSVLPPLHSADQAFSDPNSFVDNLLANPAVQLTGKLRKGANELLGTGEARTPGDSFLRNGIGANTLPLPVNKFTCPLLNSPHIAAKLARIATPVTKANDPARMMTQQIFGGSIDAIANEVTNNPAAISNTPAGKIIGDIDLDKDFSLIPSASAQQVPQAIDDVEVIGLDGAPVIPQSVFPPNTGIPDLPFADPEVVPLIPQQELNDAITNLEDQTRRAEQNQTVKDVGKTLIGIGIGAGVLRYRKRQLIQHQKNAGVTGAGPIQDTPADAHIQAILKDNGIIDHVVTGAPTASRNAANKGLNRVDELIGDGAIVLKRHLKELGYPDDEIDSLMGSSKMNHLGITGHFFRTGELGQDTGIKLPALLDMDNDLLVLSRTGKDKLYNETMVAMAELSNRKRSGGVRVGLWGRDQKPVGTEQLIKKIEKGLGDPAVNDLIRKTNEWTDGMLEYLHKRKLLTPAQAEEFKESHTVAGMRMYLPMTEQKGMETLTKKMANIVGPDSTEGQELIGLSNMYARSSEFAGGVKHPMAPMKAMKLYAIRMIEASNRNLLAYETLTRLSNLKTTSGPTGVSLERVQRQGTLRVPAKSAEDALKESDQDVRYIGKSVVDEDGSSSFQFGVNGVVDDKEIREMFTLNSAGKPLNIDLADNAMKSSNVISVMHQGEIHRFLVNDHSLRAQLFAPTPRLQKFYNILSMPKAIGQSLTTGKFSPFQPTAVVYNILNASNVLGLGSFTGLTKNSMFGIMTLLKQGAAEEVGTYTTQKIAADSGIWKYLSPDMKHAIQQKLTDAAGDSMIKSIRREQGKLATGLDMSGKVKFQTTGQIMREFAPDFNKFFGVDQMHLAYRMLGVFNNAMHQGTAFGLAQKMINDLGHAPSPKEIRKISQQAGDIVGDVNSQGTGRLMDLVHATVPYSEPTIAAFRVLGRAAARNPKKFALAYATYIGVPTMTEQAYLETLDEAGITYTDPETGEVLSYKKWFWDNLSDHRKIASFYVHIPGKHPRDGLLFPTSPEWGPGRGFLLDSANAMLNLSGDQDEVDIANPHRVHMRAGLARMFGIPMPTPLAIGLGTVGLEGSLGPNFRFSNNPSDPEGETTFFNIRGPGKGQTVTRYGDTRNVNDAVDQELSILLRSLFMGGERLIAGFADGFKAGAEPRIEGTSTVEGLKFGLQGLGHEFVKKAPFPLNPLWPNQTVPRSKTSRDVHAATSNMQLVDKDFKVRQTDGQASTDGRPFSAEVPVTQDPIYNLAQPHINFALQSIRPMQEEIAVLEKNIRIIGNSFKDINGERLTHTERTAKIDNYTMAINAKMIEIKLEISRHQEAAREEMAGHGLEWTGNFSTLKPRASAPRESITPSELLPPPQ